MKRCAWCQEILDDTKRSRRNRLTCSNRCRKALSRDAKRTRSSNSTRASSVTPDDVLYMEPPARRENPFARVDADDRWRSQYAAEAVRSQPLTPEEKAAIAWQKRNPGPLHPLLAQRVIDAERERQAAEAAERARHQPIEVEDPHRPSTMGSVARRARYDRSRNRPQDPHVSILRPGPGRSGPRPWDSSDDPQCLEWPVGRNVIPWR